MSIIKNVQRDHIANNYWSISSSFDEAVSKNGLIRQHWKPLLDQINLMGEEAFKVCNKKAHRILCEDGTTFRLHRDLDVLHTWHLNPVPFIIAKAEWNEIEQGIKERVELFNLILEDLYGAQKLIHDGVIPPEIIYSYSGFLRPCHQVFLPTNYQLFLHSVDIMRSSHGDMIVVADKTQTPIGVGYALENRAVMTRAFSKLYRENKMCYLSDYFSRLKQSLIQLSPHDGQSRVVILTKGASSEGYFEHAYLANYLGLPLVQGSDLTVRNCHVWLKSLDGLKRVDVILRFLEDKHCDPLELHGESNLGVPGLLSVARAKRVALVNPIGSGVLENSAIYRYLPQIAKYFFGRELRLKTARTWWCGNPEDLSYILTHLSQLVIKPCYRQHGVAPIYGANLSPSALVYWREYLQRNPLRYIAQEYVSGACSPTWFDGQLKPFSSVLRTFSVFSQNAYYVMPGGLTRVHLDEHTSNKPICYHSKFEKSESKDTWVLARSRTESKEERAVHRQKKFAMNSIVLSSRVAEHLYWMSRYTERSEATIRLLRIAFVQANKEEDQSRDCYHTLLQAVTHMTSTYPGFTAPYTGTLHDPEQELIDIVTNHRRLGSLAYNLKCMMNTAEQVRDQFSSDTHRLFNTISDDLYALEKSVYHLDEVEELMDRLVTTLLALSGLFQESMIHDQAWYFIKVGQHIERILHTSRLTQALFLQRLSADDEEYLLEAALSTSEMLVTYRRCYHNTPTLALGLPLLLLDKTNPRSVLYQVFGLHNRVELLSHQLESHHLSQSYENALPLYTKRLLEALALLQLCEVDDLIQCSSKGQRTSLDHVLRRLQELTHDSAKSLSQRYFDHLEDPKILESSQGYWDDI